MAHTHTHIMMSVQNKEIKAVHIADLDNLLKKYDQLQDFHNGEIRCQICSNEITPKNVGSMKLTNNKFLFFCNNASCCDQIVKISNSSMSTQL